jgi:hypothetical protein
MKATPLKPRAANALKALFSDEKVKRIPGKLFTLLD